jgi:hypothetical protein
VSVAKLFPLREVMPAEVFYGSTGDLIIRQEWTSLVGGETYTLIRIPMSEAEALAGAIMAAAHSADYARRK